MNLKKAKYILSLLLIGVVAGCSSQTVEPEDKAFIVQASDLAKYGYGFKPISKYETFSKTAYADGSTDLEYKFETHDTEVKEPMYMTVSLSSSNSSRDAVMNESIEKTVGGLALKSQDVKETPIKGAKQYGDASTLSLLSVKGMPVGNHFVCRKGGRNYSITTVGGLYIDDPALWDELVQAKVNKWLSPPTQK